jgi:hypothetical protein
MIVPASVADWAMFAGLLASLSGVATLGSRWIFKEPAEHTAVAVERIAPQQLDRPAA